jgi:hypothetical protein
MLRKPFAFAPIAATLAASGLTVLLLNSAACTSSTDNPEPSDASTGADTSTPNPGQDSGPTPIVDGGSGNDATIPQGDGGPGHPTGDANVDIDGNVTGDAGDGGGLTGCAAVLSKLFNAPVLPPAGWGGLDLSKGGAVDGGAYGGGLTIDEAAILACASSVEPDVLEAGATPILPGARTATFSDDAGHSTTVSYNLDSRVIWQVATNSPNGSKLTFHARAGGPYAAGGPDGGPSTYEIGFGNDPDAGTGYVRKNGVDLPADWNDAQDDAGAYHASAWVNELYDGIMATFAPGVPAVPDCRDAPWERAVVPQRESACLANGFVLGIRPLGTYIYFANGTAQAQGMYNFWPGGWPSCSSPNAAIESAESLPVTLLGNGNTMIGPQWWGAGIGGLFAADPVTNANGLLASEANALLGCQPTTVTPMDPGYAEQTWGGGALGVEYNADSGVAYKVIASQGYKGQLDVVAPENDGGTNEYLVGVGALTVNGAPVTLDWADGDAGTLNSVATDISNGWQQYFCGQVDDDCVDAGDCVITPDDGNGHSVLQLVLGPGLVGACLDPHPLTFVFPKGGSVPSQVIATNPGGQ